MSTLDTKTIKELVAIHNANCKDDAAIKTFKGRKDDLVATVAGLMRKSRGSTIKVFVETLLLETAEKKDGQKIGHPYDHVLALVLEEFPEANTTVKCLRWYNTKLNGDASVQMPIRPRKKTVKPTVTEAPAKVAPIAKVPSELVDADPIA